MATLVIVGGTLLLLALGAALLYRQQRAVQSAAPGLGTRSTATFGVLAVALIGLIALWLFSALTLPQPRTYQVLVAPFTVTGGTDDTGRRAAEQLVGALNAERGQGYVARLTASAPADAAAAQQQLIAAGADALVWGELAAGGVIDAPTLTPQLALAPKPADAANGWEGYPGRFATPPSFQLAQRPINARVVLPPLLHALATYATGQFDQTAATLDRLIADNPDLEPALPRMLRGNLHWASGDFRAAADEYRRIPAVAGRGGSPDDAPLASNLGAILQDANDPGARLALNQAIALLNGADLGALRFNLAIEELRAGHAAAALAGLQQARNLLPETAAVHFALADAARNSGPELFDTAQRELDLGLGQATSASSALGGDLEAPLLLRNQTTALEQRSLLALAQQLTARGPLLWELWRTAPLSAEKLTPIQRDLTLAASDSARLAQQWRERSARDTAADLPVAALVADEQARRADSAGHDRQLWADAIEVRLGQQQPAQLGSVWGLLGASSSNQLRTRLENRAQQNANDITARVLAAQTYQAARQNQKAIDQLDVLIASAPNRPEPYYARALLEDDPAKRQTLLTQALNAEPRFFPAREALAEIAEQSGDDPGAIAQRQMLLADRPGPEQQLALGHALRHAKRYADAERQLLPLANANNVGALLELGELYGETDDTNAALTVLNRAAQMAPNDAMTIVALGDALRHAGQPTEAEAQYRRALTFNPRDPEVHLKLANLYAEQQKDAQAAVEYEAALNIQTPNATTLTEIGDALLRRDQPAAAVKAYERAAALGPNNAELQRSLATAYLRAGDLAQARTAAQQALTLSNGTDPDMIAGLGEIALLQDRPEEAQQLFSRALELRPGMITAQIGLGRVAVAQQNWNVALAHFRSAVQADPNSPTAQLWLGEGLVRQGEFRSALAAYQAALDQQPTYAEAHFGKGQVLLALNQPDDALAEVNQAIQIRPRYAEALLLRGRIFEGRSETDQALRDYGAAININPSCPSRTTSAGWRWCGKSALMPPAAIFRPRSRSSRPIPRRTIGSAGCCSSRTTRSRRWLR